MARWTTFGFWKGHGVAGDCHVTVRLQSKRAEISAEMVLVSLNTVGLCVQWLCVQWFCVQWLCVQWLCVQWLCVQWFCVQWLCVQWLCVQWLCVQWLCVQWLCVQWLCVQWSISLPYINTCITNNKHSTSIASISGFRRDVDEICALLGCYVASCGDCLPTFRESVSKSPDSDSWPVSVVPIR
jgi:hypothetical protein